MTALVVAAICCAVCAVGTSEISSPTQCTGDQDATCASEYFPDIPHIPYEGPSSRNVLAFRYFNRDEVIYGRPMHEWLRFSLAFWHTMRGDGSDMFGSATRVR